MDKYINEYENLCIILDGIKSEFPSNEASIDQLLKAVRSNISFLERHQRSMLSLEDTLIDIIGVSNKQEVGQILKLVDDYAHATKLNVKLIERRTRNRRKIQELREAIRASKQQQRRYWRLIDDDEWKRRHRDIIRRVRKKN